jgi:hypothetical protein
VGLAPATLNAPEARIPYPTVDALTEVVAARVKDPALGLELSGIYEPDTYDVTGLVLMASPSPRCPFLGYANPTTFHRAFKRWTGESPEHSRARPGNQEGADEGEDSAQGERI